MRKSRFDNTTRSVLGLDLSLRRPAACVIPEGWQVGDWKALHLLAFDGEDSHDERSHYARIIKIVGKMRDFMLAYGVGLNDAWVEGYAFSRNSSSVTKLAELGGVARCEFLSYGRVLRAVPQSSVRKLLLGKVPREDPKKFVQAAFCEAEAPFWEDPDICDAVAVANWGLSEQGKPAITFR